MRATSAQSCFPVVGIGASTGGLRALEGFFPPCPPIQAWLSSSSRISRRIESLLVDFCPPCRFARRSRRRRSMVKADKVYVMPPNATLTIDEGRLRLAEIPHDRHERTPIDIFFSSLARSCGEYAVGVVLSGSGADGVLGVKAIKENSGLTMAQTLDGSGPGFTGMPDSAIATGLIDFATPVEGMAQDLSTTPKPLKERKLSSKRKAIQKPTLQAMRKATRTRAIKLGRRRRPLSARFCAPGPAHDFSGYKTATFLRRIHRRMRIRQCESLAAYVELLDKIRARRHCCFATC